MTDAGLTDYHIHLRPDRLDISPASKYFTVDNVAKYFAAARRQGIDELGVSEHIYRFTAALDIWNHPLWEKSAKDDIDEYCDFVQTSTDLKLGIEADYLEGHEDRIAECLGRRSFDYVIGSVHFFSDGRAVEHPDFEVWRWRPAPEVVWRRYFELLGKAAASGLFDILAHPDLVKVWGRSRPVPDGDLRRFYELAMDGIAATKPAIEVSTSGLRKPVGEMFPSPEFLQMAVDAGAVVALSSDAHEPHLVGYGYEFAVEWLHELGIQNISVFTRRKRQARQLLAAM